VVIKLGTFGKYIFDNKTLIQFNVKSDSMIMSHIANRIMHPNKCRMFLRYRFLFGRCLKKTWILSTGLGILFCINNINYRGYTIKSCFLPLPVWIVTKKFTIWGGGLLKKNSLSNLSSENILGLTNRPEIHHCFFNQTSTGKSAAGSILE
jgi:hypothetical protein